MIRGLNLGRGKRYFSTTFTLALAPINIFYWKAKRPTREGDQRLVRNLRMDGAILPLANTEMRLFAVEYVVY